MSQVPDRAARFARRLLRPDGTDAARRRAEERERRDAVPAARPYAGLASQSLALASISVDPASARAINLLIGEVREDRMFAGIHTALQFGVALAAELRRPLRVVMLDVLSTGNSVSAIADYLTREFGADDVTVVPREQLSQPTFGASDDWIATHFLTAHAAAVACAAGLIDATRVVYLVQDYEPGFVPWSTTSVLAQATYHAGFLPVVNSVPLAGYLRATEDMAIENALVFAPDFDTARLQRTAAARRSGTPTVLFYGRPSKPRNLYALGVAALRAAVAEFGSEASGIRFVSAGESSDDVDLGAGVVLRSLGRLDWDAYFDFLAETTVMLSLQASAHPSHPPFDAAISGALAITNDFGGTRADLHPRLAAVAADVPALAAAIVEAVRFPSAATDYRPVSAGALGLPLAQVVTTLAGRLA